MCSVRNSDPTQTTYKSLSAAYDHFNLALFQGALPNCLITVQRKKGAYGYFAAGRFGAADGSEVTDEIALNPSHFKGRSREAVLSTLAHEMVHLWQHHAGKPSRTGYHNTEWAARMESVGLMPSDTGAPGGKRTGQNMTHYIVVGGPFALACADLLMSGDMAALYVELWSDEQAAKARKKAASKTKYTCGSCAANAWAKPQANLMCGDCDERMCADDGDEGGEDEDIPYQVAA